MQNIQIARIACAAEQAAMGGEGWSEFSDDDRGKMIEAVHALREGGQSDNSVFDQVALACIAEGDMLADDFDGQAVEVRNGALAYAIQHHKGEAKPSEVTATAADFEAFLLGKGKPRG